VGFFNRYKIALLILCFVSSSAFAFSWSDLWLTPNQQAAKALKKGQAKKAAELFRSPEWKAVANYRSKDYQQALKDFSKRKNAAADYNRGNSLAHMKQYQAAIDAYSQALKKQPDFENAKFNRELIEKLQKQKKQQQKQNSKDQNKKNQKKQSKQDQKKSQNGQDKQDQKQNEKNQDNQNKQDKQKNQEKNKQGYDQRQQQQNKQNADKQSIYIIIIIANSHITPTACSSQLL